MFTVFLLSTVHPLLSCQTQQFLLTKFSYPCSILVCSQQNVAKVFVIVASSCLHLYLSFCNNLVAAQQIPMKLCVKDFTKLSSTFQLGLM
jgi:hypothetical protein